MADKALHLQHQIKENAQELGDFLSELNKWEKDIKRKDDELKKTAEIEKIAPPIRQAAAKGKKSNLQKEKKAKLKEEKQKPQKQRISSYDYDAWSKFDVDAACEDAAKKEESEESDGTDVEEEEDLEAVMEAEAQRKFQQAEFEKDKGNNLFKDGKYEAAISRYTVAANLNPQSSIILANRAMALIKVERYAAAEVDCTEALKLDPTYGKAVARRATARAKLKKFKEAKEDQERLLELQPNNNNAKMEIAKLDKELSKIEKTNQSSANLKRTRKPLKRIVIQDIGSDSEDEEAKPQTMEQGKQQEPSDERQNDGSLQQPRQEMKTKVGTTLEGDTFAPVEQQCVAKTLSVPTTAVQFETEFKKLKRNADEFYEYFKVIAPKSYKTLFHHCIDEVMPNAIECIHKYYIRDEKEYFEELKFLAEVPRFDMALMFLSKGTKKVVSDLFENLLKKNSTEMPQKEEIDKLAVKYAVKLKT